MMRSHYKRKTGVIIENGKTVPLLLKEVAGGEYASCLLP